MLLFSSRYNNYDITKWFNAMPFWCITAQWQKWASHKHEQTFHFDIAMHETYSTQWKGYSFGYLPPLLITFHTVLSALEFLLKFGYTYKIEWWTLRNHYIDEIKAWQSNLHYGLSTKVLRYFCILVYLMHDMSIQLVVIQLFQRPSARVISRN